MKRIFIYIVTALLPMMAQAQSSLYEHHFNLKEVKLLDGPMKTALERNNQLLLQYDADRLLSPFVRQAGLNTGRYAGWPLTVFAPDFETTTPLRTLRAPRVVFSVLIRS